MTSLQWDLGWVPIRSNSESTLAGAEAGIGTRYQALASCKPQLLQVQPYCNPE